MLTMSTLEAEMMKGLWRNDAVLTATGLLMLGLLPLFVVGLALDPRTVTGAPVWLKPAKFAASIGIYTLTLAWIFGYLREWPRTRVLVSGITAAAMVIEMAIIAFQAARGAASHFNVATPFDAALWKVMGATIVLQTVASVAVAAALWRQRFADRAMGWALRLGMAITIVGAFSGGLMARPTANQLAVAAQGQRLTMAGGHTVGGPDGGPGLPGTGWSAAHGDLRIAHFVGLHALQALPLLVLLGRRGRGGLPVSARAAVAAGVSYAALFALLLWQALRGQSIVAPDAAAGVAFGAWAAASAVGAWGGRHVA